MIESANFSGAILAQITFIDGIAIGANFSNGTLTNSNLTKANFTDGNFTRTTIANNITVDTVGLPPTPVTV